MSLFSKKSVALEPTQNLAPSENPLPARALNAIHDGVIITDADGLIKFINPAAARLSGFGTVEECLDLDYNSVLKLADLDGNKLNDAENELSRAFKTGQPLENYHAALMQNDSKTLPISLSLVIDETGGRIMTFRNIEKELAEESGRSDFISTASHEMRTPVASIEGYLSLALNPQTATIDERARGYLASAHTAAEHLGHLFQDLLDVTKLDDGRIRPKMQPVELVSLTRQVAESYNTAVKNARLNLIFGSQKNASFSEVRRVEQVVYGFVDIDFMRLILGNLLENAIKYTPAGGSIYVNVVGDGDKVKITVADTGIGISAEDLPHIFGKFYRADNSDTRTIGGTGLGLYLVKQRAEALGGSVSAVSTMKEGSIFTVTLPRLSSDEYEKRMIAMNNNLGGNL